MESITVQGRLLRSWELAQIGQWIAEHPHWSRWRLSQHLAWEWNWRNGAGQLKDMAARSLLLKLQGRGLVKLPARRRAAFKRMGRVQKAQAPWDTRLIECELAELGPLQIKEVSGLPKERSRFAAALAQFHYLGYSGTVGENLQYVVLNSQGRVLALCLFSAAAWKCQARDQFIGWEPESRERSLPWITNNSRWLILPWVKVAQLGSWTLSRVVGRLSKDWQLKYGHGIALVETFVERDRFEGTVYQAANWVRVGASAGRTRQDPDNKLQVPIKDIYLYPLRRDFREVLRA
jgi:hypothetical protein